MFISNGVRYVFAASDRPTIVHSSNHKLLYSNLNEDEVVYSMHSTLPLLSYESSAVVEKLSTPD